MKKSKRLGVTKINMRVIFVKKMINFILSLVMVLSIATGAAVTVNAAGLKAGDTFYAEIDINTGELTGKVSIDDMKVKDPMYECVVKEDGTISVELFTSSDGYYHYLWFSTVDLNANEWYVGDCFIIPSKINGYTVTEITGKYGGMGCLGVAKVIIPETVTKIGDRAFMEAFFLEEVEFSGKSRLKEIGALAFSDCRHLKSITIPASVETIGTMAFYNTDKNFRDYYEAQDGYAPKYFDGHLGGLFATPNCLLGAFSDIMQIDYDGKKEWVYNITNPELVLDDLYSLTSVKFEKGSKLKSIASSVFQNQPNIDLLGSLPENLESIYFSNLLGASEAVSSRSLDDVVKYLENKGIELLDPNGAVIDDTYLEEYYASKNESDDKIDSKSDNKSDKKTETKTDNETKTKTDKKVESKPAAKNDMPSIYCAKSEYYCTIELYWSNVGTDRYNVYISRNGVDYTNCGVFRGQYAEITRFGKGDDAKKLGCGSTYYVKVIRSDYKGTLSEALKECSTAKVTVK